jgi:Arc/MetJ family transcription regulator
VLSQVIAALYFHSDRAAYHVLVRGLVNIQTESILRAHEARADAFSPPTAHLR